MIPSRVERARASHQLVEHRARREEVAAAVHDLASHLLRRHVFGGAHHHPRARDVAHGEAGHAEVHDLDPALPGEEDVGGLDVAVDDPDLVGVGQAFEHGDHDRDLALEAEGRSGPHRVEEVVPAEELHRDVGRAVGVVAEVEDGHHVGVHHARDRARFALEAVLLLRVARDLGQHHLEGDVRSRSGSRAWYTTPMAPGPRRPRISYLPTRGGKSGAMASGCGSGETSSGSELKPVNSTEGRWH